MNINAVTIEYQAFQDLRGDLAEQIEQMDDRLISASELRRKFGITSTVLQKLRASRRIRPIRRSRKRNARVHYSLRQVLLALVRDGVYATGRIRNVTVKV